MIKTGGFDKDAFGEHQTGPKSPFILTTDWHMWGYEHTLEAQPFVGGESEAGPFQVILRLARIDETTRQPITKGDMVAQYLDGDSNYSFAAGKRTMLVSSVGSPVPLSIVHNGEENAAALRFGPFDAHNRRVAAAYARGCFLQMSSYLSVTFDVPLSTVAMLVLGPDARVLMSQFIVPYPKVSIDEFSPSAPRVLLPLFAMYDDALRSRSRFYSFLCFFKISDYILTTLFPRFARLQKTLGDDVSLPTETLPEEPFRYIAKDLVGETFTRVRDAFYKPYRVEIAHFNEGATLRSDDPAMVEMITQAEHVMRYIAKRTLLTCVTEIQALTRRGVAEASFDTGLSQGNTTEIA